MVSIAACATCGIKLESWKQTCKAIMQMFKEQMKGLKECLNVSFKHYIVNWNLIHNMIKSNTQHDRASHQWRGQFDMWCIAGLQCRHLFCCHWSLDWGGKGRRLGWTWSPFWIYTNEHGTQWCLIGPGIVQDLPMAWNHWEGTAVCTCLCILQINTGLAHCYARIL